MLDKPLESMDSEEIIRLIAEAHQDIIEAIGVFNLMVEPELIDYAIHKMGAAENRYRYLLRWARERDVVYMIPRKSGRWSIDARANG